MKLGIRDRITLSMLYPRESNLVTQTLIRDIDSKTRLSQEEIKEIEFIAQPTQSGHAYRWNEEKAIEKDVEFSEAELNMLKAQVERLDKENKITQQTIDVCLKIKNA